MCGECGVVGLCERGDLLDVGDASSEAEIGSGVLGSSGFEHIAELPDVVDAFAVGDGKCGALCDGALENHAVDLYGVFVEEWVELFEFLREGDGVHWGKFAMDLENDVDVFPGAFAHGSDVIDGVRDQTFERHALEAIW